MIEVIKAALVSTLVSALISGVGIFYLQRYLDAKRTESEAQAARRREERRRADMLEARRRRAAGRLFFWLHYAVVRGPEQANGDLEKSFVDYNEVEEEQKAFEQELLAEHQEENRRSAYRYGNSWN